MNKTGADKQKKERLGICNYNNNNEHMTIIEYINSHNIIIEFEDGTIVENKGYSAFINGEIRNPNSKKYFNVGFLGQGKYTTLTNKKSSKQYKVWSHMLERCYDVDSYEKQHTYKGCTVCDEWLNFQVFAKWHDENYYDVEGGYVLG